MGRWVGGEQVGELGVGGWWVGYYMVGGSMIGGRWVGWRPVVAGRWPVGSPWFCNTLSGRNMQRGINFGGSWFGIKFLGIKKSVTISFYF